MADDGFTIRHETVAPTIIVRPAEIHTRVADDGLAALHHAGAEVFIRSRRLVRVTKVKAKSADKRMADGTVTKGQGLLVPGVDTIGSTVLLRELSRATRWARMKPKGELVFIAPPKEVASQILCMVNEWPFLPLNGIISTQTIRPDGTLLLRPGYDHDTGYFLHNPPPIPSIPDHPTKDDARDALALFRDLLGEFPFTSEASFSVAMSGILTALARPGVGAAAPLHLATSPRPVQASPPFGMSPRSSPPASVAPSFRCRRSRRSSRNGLSGWRSAALRCSR